VDRRGPPEAFARGHPQGAASERRRRGETESRKARLRRREENAGRRAERRHASRKARVKQKDCRASRRAVPLPFRTEGQCQNPGRVRAAGTMETTQ